jgi:pullulanase/glycogen debranching enzyme
MASEDWGEGDSGVVVWLNGVLGETDKRRAPVVGRSLIVAVNASWSEVGLRLPEQRWGGTWEVLLDTTDPGSVDVRHPAGAALALPAAAVLVLGEVPSG